jgi:hypothetical protein
LRCFRGFQSATMGTNGVGFRIRLGFRFLRCWLSESPPVVMLLNGEGGGEQALKGLLVQCQVRPVRGHGIGGRRNVQTDTIVVQVGPFGNEENAGLLGGIPFGGARSGNDS